MFLYRSVNAHSDCWPILWRKLFFRSCQRDFACGACCAMACKASLQNFPCTYLRCFWGQICQRLACGDDWAVACGISIICELARVLAQGVLGSSLRRVLGACRFDSGFCHVPSWFEEILACSSPRNLLRFSLQGLLGSGLQNFLRGSF